ncbi:MAG: carboxymuconolactone decarboxylase family protein [Methermicoccaceae archaeon]
MSIRELLKKLEDCSQDEVEELLEQVKDRYGEVPYIMEKMREENPKLLASKVLYDVAMMDGFKHIDPETVELISIAVASAIRCRACIDLHVRVAKRMGIPDEAIMTSMLIAASLSNAAVLADATRSLDAAQREEDEKEGGCAECRIPTFDK